MMGFCHFWIFMVWWDLVWWYFQSLFRHLLVLWKYCRVTFKPCKTNQPDRQSHDQRLQKLDHLSRFLIVQSCLNGWFAYILHPKPTKHDQISGFIELPSASCWKPNAEYRQVPDIRGTEARPPMALCACPGFLRSVDVWSIEEWLLFWLTAN